MAGGAPLGIPASDASHLYVIASSIRAYSRSTGAFLWQAPLHKYPPWKLLANQGRLFVVEDTVYALDARDGKLLWEFRPDENASFGRATVGNGVLYFGTRHKLYALRADDGKQLWVTDLGLDSRFPSVVRGVTVEGGELYACIEQWRSANGNISSGWLMAAEAGSGRIRWRFATGRDQERQGFSSSPVIAGDLVLAADYLSNALVAVTRTHGNLRWRFAGEPGFVGIAETPVISGSTVYVASGDMHTYALRLDDGKMLWSTRLPGSSEGYALCGNVLLVNHFGISVLDIKTGAVVQQLLDSESEYVTSGIATNGNSAFVAGPRGIYSVQCK